MAKFSRGAVGPGQRNAAGQQHAADSGGQVQVQRHREVTEPAAPRFGQAGQPRVVADQHGDGADGSGAPAPPTRPPRPRRPARAAPCGPGSPATARPRRSRSGAGRGPSGEQRAAARGCSAGPKPEADWRSRRSSMVPRPVSSKDATEKESSRRSTARATGPYGCGDGTPVGRPRERCTASSPLTWSSSMRLRSARSRTSTVAVPRARLSWRVSSARVRIPPPSWIARSRRAKLCARRSALVVAPSMSSPTL